MSRQALVLDANILVRAVLGKRVFKLLNQYHSTTVFFAPDEAFADAEKYLPQIFESRGLDWVGYPHWCSVSNLMSIANLKPTHGNVSETFVIGRC
jgi:hypothetical protein